MDDTNQPIHSALPYSVPTDGLGKPDANGLRPITDANTHLQALQSHIRQVSSNLAGNTSSFIPSQGTQANTPKPYKGLIGRSFDQASGQITGGLINTGLNTVTGGLYGQAKDYLNNQAGNLGSWMGGNKQSQYEGDSDQD